MAKNGFQCREGAQESDCLARLRVASFFDCVHGRHSPVRTYLAMGAVRLKKWTLERSTGDKRDWFFGVNNCDDYVPVIDFALPDVRNTGWRESKFGSCWTILKRPTDEQLDRLRTLLDVLSRTLLVRRSAVLAGTFTDELAYCAALDFNFLNAQTRTYTEIGGLEYRAKYESDAASLTKLAAEVASAVRTNPVFRVTEMIAAVPSSSRVAATLAKAAAEALNRPLAEVTKKTTESMKSLRADRKIEALSDAYAVEAAVKGKTILLVDDLFQSGASMWALARAARNAGAVRVQGLVSVKSWRDTDNT